jgi:hypothetical protein
MLNAFYAGLKSADPAALVVTAGTAPFGDIQPGGPRLQPVRFWRGVLCTAAPSCADPAHFDVLAHNMYSWGSPQTPAYWPDDVAIPDLWKLTRVLHTAERSGHALPREPHPVWITEVGYDSNPPNPYGVPVATEARWLDEALAELWREGAAAIFWYQVVDDPPIPSLAYATESGLYYVNGEPKSPMLRAFQFPFEAWGAGGTRVDVWVRSPVGGRLYVERSGRSGWKTVHALDVRAGEPFLTSITDRGGWGVRAQIGSRSSAVWRLS